MGKSSLLGVPVYTFSSHKGMGEAPKTLRKAGIRSALGDPADKKDIKLGKLRNDLEGVGVKNLDYFREACGLIYKEVRSLDSEFVFLLGGECSIVVGSLAGLSETFKGKPGLLWLDSHGDFNTPETSPSGYIGGMCLAMACGRGPTLGDVIENRRPLVSEESLVHVGSRALDPPEVAAFNSSPAKLFTSQQVRKSGAGDVAREASRHLENRSDWIVCHVDVDVIDPSLVPAVSYPAPGGLTVEEVAAIVRSAMGTGKVKAVELTAYNPSKDKGRASAEVICGLMKNILS